MILSLNIDLRKKYPLGSGIAKLARQAKKDYATFNAMGEPDPAKPGYSEHKNERERLFRAAFAVRSALWDIAQLLGPAISIKIPELKWAVSVCDYGTRLSDDVSWEKRFECCKNPVKSFRKIS